MIIRNQGLVVCGTSIEETFSNLRNAITACSAQVIFTSSYLLSSYLTFFFQVTALSCVRVEKLTQLSRDDVILSDDHVTSSEAKSNADAMQFEAVVRTLDNMVSYHHLLVSKFVIFSIFFYLLRIILLLKVNFCFCCPKI